jgi:hypothetical protein
MHVNLMLFISGVGVGLSILGILVDSTGTRLWAASSGLWALSTFLAYF